MTSLYLLSDSALILLTMALILTSLFQIAVIANLFYELSNNFRRGISLLLEVFVFLHIFTILIVVAQISYHKVNFFSINDYPVFQVTIFFIILLLSVISSFLNKDILYLIIPTFASLTLPIAQQISGHIFPLLMMITVIFWLSRSFRKLIIAFNARKKTLSAYSIKEAIDTLNFGLLCFRGQGLSFGEIFLSNAAMQKLMFTLTCKEFYNGREFYDCLVRGDVNSDCVKNSLCSRPSFTLPDGHTWEFENRKIFIKHIPCYLLIASDITLYQDSNLQLQEKQSQLETQNRELTELLHHLESTCKAEELAHIKSRVHDVLGQRISLLLSSIREHKHPNPELLYSFANGLPNELKNMPADPEYAFKLLAEDFKGLGVTVHLDGKLPTKEPLQTAFFEISLEAVTNAVRHGYATEINVSITNDKNLWQLKISDNGTPNTSEIQEGGGFAGMRHKASEFGGSFDYCTSPKFTITITIPKGD